MTTFESCVGKNASAVVYGNLSCLTPTPTDYSSEEDAVSSESGIGAFTSHEADVEGAPLNKEASD